MTLNNTQYESIMREYEQTKDRNRRILEDRREEMYAKIPELSELADNVSTLAIRRSRALLAGDDDALEALRLELAALRLRREDLLSEAGYPADYLEPVYTCRDCEDTGYILTADGYREKCHCLRDKEIALLYEQSNIRQLLADQTFADLSYDYYEGRDLDLFRRAVKISYNFVENFNQDYHNLFFYGTVGTGKSFLSGCIANELMQGGHSVIYYSAVSLFDTLARYSFDAKSKEELHSFYRDLYDFDLLIIDDLGTEVTNSFVASQLFSCLNERHLRKRPTIISTNLNLEELRDRYSDRVFSRIISNYTACKLTGPDIRMAKRTSGN